MGQQWNALKRREMASALALLAMSLLAASSGCGVRADSRLNQAPLPICNEVAPETCQTLENSEVFEAPSWLVRCRRGWLHWRHGHETPVEREAIVIPPPPRFHPVPTRPVFAPLEFEAPFATLAPQPQKNDSAPPVPPTPNPKVAPEEIPGPQKSDAPADPSPVDAPKPAQESPPTAIRNSEGEGAETAIAPPKLLPRVLMPKTSRQTTIAPPVRATIKPNPISSKIPDVPLATEPLEESASSPAWKPRR